MSMITFSQVRAFFGGPSISGFARETDRVAAGERVVALFYLLWVAMAYEQFMLWPVPLAQQNIVPVWQLHWLQFFTPDLDALVNAVRLICLATAILGIVFYRSRVVRILVCFGIAEIHGLASSFAQPNHQLYPWLYVSFILIFLPSFTRRGFERDRDLLLVVWWAQTAFMLLYTMAGFWKFEVAIEQLLHGAVNGLSPFGFAYQVAAWVPQLQNDAVLAPSIIAHPYLAWPFYVASHCFQLFALWIMVRPSLQRVWMVELILFHIGTYLAMGIQFDPFIYLLVALFFGSPFLPEKSDLRDILLDWPVIGQILEASGVRRHA